MTEYVDIPSLDVKSEGICLGLAMQYRDDLDVVCDTLRTCMLSPAGSVILDALRHFRRRDYNPSVDDIITHLTQSGTIDAAGGAMHLYAIAAHARPCEIRYYCDQVITAWQRVQLSEEARLILRTIADDPTATIDRVSAKLASLSKSERRSTVTISQAIDAYKGDGFANSVTSADPVDSASLSWPKLDDLLGGLVPGRMLVIAARPGVGKTDFICHMIHQLIFKDITTMLFSLEMNADEVCNRIVGITAGVPHRKIDRKDLLPFECDKAVDASSKLSTKGNNLIIDDSVGLNVSNIRSRLRKEAIKRPIKVVFIDHLGLLEAETKETSRYEIVTESSRRLKVMAKETGTCVVVVSQLNRQSVHRDNNRPTMADLRDSGSVEQDADQVILLHREDYFDSSKNVGGVEAIVDKNRHGERGLVKFKYNKMLYTLKEESVDEIKKQDLWSKD